MSSLVKNTFGGDNEVYVGVSGDFYDFLHLHDGRKGIIAGEVSGKGVPAAPVKATTRSVLRAPVMLANAPSKILARTINQAVEKVYEKFQISCK